MRVARFGCKALSSIDRQVYSLRPVHFTEPECSEHDAAVNASRYGYVGVPYSVAELRGTEAGGTPYGASHWATEAGDRPLDEREAAICRALGKRVADWALRRPKAQI